MSQKGYIVLIFLFFGAVGFLATALLSPVSAPLVTLILGVLAAGECRRSQQIRARILTVMSAYFGSVAGVIVTSLACLMPWPWVCNVGSVSAVSFFLGAVLGVQCLKKGGWTI